jgi:hypothetical protein
MSPGVPVCNRLITVLAMAPSGLCPNSAHGEVCGTTNFLLSKCEDLSKMTSQWLPLSVKRVASATDEPFHQFIYTLRDTCCQIICCDLMEFDYFMMCKVSQWQHFWQFFILWIITIVQSPGVLKHNNQHHIHVPNYQNGKIGWRTVFVHHNVVAPKSCILSIESQMYESTQSWCHLIESWENVLGIQIFLLLRVYLLINISWYHAVDWTKQQSNTRFSL